MSTKYHSKLLLAFQSFDNQSCSLINDHYADNLMKKRGGILLVVNVYALLLIGWLHMILTLFM
jgi:hypothetical protein